MSDVKRYDCTNGGSRYCQGCYTMTETPLGDYVSSDDYEALEAEAQALREEVSALRARVVAPDEYAEFEAWLEREKPAGCIGDMERGWMERARLNGKVVSEGLLRRVCLEAPAVQDMHEQSSWELAHFKAVEELRALLGEGKEVGDANPANA